MHRSRKAILAPALLFFSVFAASGIKPTVADDGFPTGQNSPEGAATDLARAFIQQDADLFLRTCVPPYGGGGTLSAYKDYLDGASHAMRLERSSHMRSQENPHTIKRVFAARNLSRNGPASYGYAAFDFQEVLFVDVDVILNDGASYVKRTLVIQARDGRWYAHPKPDLSPLLSMGLDNETPSIKIVAASR